MDDTRGGPPIRFRYVVGYDLNFQKFQRDRRWTKQRNGGKLIIISGVS